MLLCNDTSFFMCVVLYSFGLLFSADSSQTCLPEELACTYLPKALEATRKKVRGAGVAGESEDTDIGEVETRGPEAAASVRAVRPGVEVLDEGGAVAYVEPIELTRPKLSSARTETERARHAELEELEGKYERLRANASGSFSRYTLTGDAEAINEALLCARECHHLYHNEIKPRYQALQAAGSYCCAVM